MGRFRHDWEREPDDQPPPYGYVVAVVLTVLFVLALMAVDVIAGAP